MSEPVNFIVEHYDNEELAEANEQLAMMVAKLHIKNAKLREYVTELETANLDVTARLADYIGQYDPTDAFVAEVKAENAKLMDQKADAYNDMVIARLDADELQAEIAMLKELLRDMAAEIRGLGVDFARVGWCDYADRMRELGVEV